MANFEGEGEVTLITELGDRKQQDVLNGEDPTERHSRQHSADYRTDTETYCEEGE